MEPNLTDQYLGTTELSKYLYTLIQTINIYPGNM